MILKKAFTMIELIFVIVIMGILSKFGFEFLAQAYNSFIYTKINTELHEKSNHTLEFIAKRLEARVAPSVIKRISTVNGFVAAPKDVPNKDLYNLLEWIAYDIEGFRGSGKPLWSGIIDFDTTLTTSAQLFSPDTNTTAIDNLIKILSDNNSTIANAAIIFNSGEYAIDKFGWYTAPNGITDQNNSAIHPVTSTANNIFTSSNGVDFTGLNIYNRYALAWTAYALLHNTNNQLVLYYNYQPWEGETYLDATKIVILMEDVSEFRILPSPDGKLYSLKVCVKSNFTSQEHSICKEKTIF